MSVSSFTIDLPRHLDALRHANGRELEFGPGVYDFGGADISGGGLSPGGDVGPVNIVGVPGQTVFKNIGTAHYSGQVSFRGVTFKDCAQPVYMTGVVDFVRIFDCNFEDATRSIFHNDTAGTAENVQIIGNTFRNSIAIDDFVGCVLFDRAAGISDMLIAGNRALGIKAHGANHAHCFIAGDADMPAKNFQRIVMERNFLSQCGNFCEDAPTVSSLGCAIVGVDSTQDKNVLRDGGWINAFYMKGHGNQQTSNRAHNPQWSGVTMKTDMDGASRDNFQNGNLVTGCVDAKAAIRMFGRGRSDANQVDIVSTDKASTTEGGFAFRCTPSTTDGPLRIGGTFKAPRGIEVTTAGDVTIDAALASDSDGITVMGGAYGDPGAVRITGSVRCAGRAVYVHSADSALVHDFRFETRNANHPFFLFTKQSNKLSSVSASLSGACPQALTLYGSGSGHVTYAADIDCVAVQPMNQAVRSLGSSLHIDGLSVRADVGSVVRIDSDMSAVVLNAAKVNGAVVRSIQSEKSFEDLVITNGMLPFPDDVAAHTGATVTRSRICNNKTSQGLTQP